MNKKIRLLSVALVVAATMSVPTVANAQEWETPPGAVGIWKHSHYRHLLGFRYPTFGPENVSWGANNEMSSWVNKSDVRSSWWEKRNRGGFCRPMVPHYYAAEVWRNENDKLSSWASNRAGIGC